MFPGMGRRARSAGARYRKSDGRIPSGVHIFLYMKALLIELDPGTAARLEWVAPRSSRRRSEFVRAAIHRALWELEERAIEAAYLRQPDSAGEAHVDPDAWEALPRHRRARSRRRR